MRLVHYKLYTDYNIAPKGILMTLEEIQAKIESGIENSVVTMEGDGCNCSTLVVSPVFEGMSLLSRQRAVMSLVSEDIKSGELHALSVKTRTPEENS